MQRLALLCISIICFSCSNTINPEDLTLLNGYWEIKSVTFKDGKTKEYQINTTIDYIKVEELDGFRKKVQPKLTGTYETSEDAEKFILVPNEGSYTFQYESTLSTWKEELIRISSNEFSVKNEQEKIYTYQRYTPINITN